MNLISKKCVPCGGGVSPLSADEVKRYMAELNNGWNYQRGPSSLVKREFKFKDFKEAMVFVNKVADIADQEERHPDIVIHYNKVNIILWTHTIGGLSENDFILAAKIDNLIQ